MQHAYVSLNAMRQLLQNLVAFPESKKALYVLANKDIPHRSHIFGYQHWIKNYR